MSEGRTRLVWVVLVVSILAGGLVYQVAGAYSQTRSDLLAVRKSIGQPGLWRSANFTWGLNFANYVNFLVENIAVDATVVLPPEDVGAWILGNTPYMQFFLAPRSVLNCTETYQRCAANLSAQGASLLVASPDNPLWEDVLERPEQTRMFNDNWGVYISDNGVAGARTQAYTSLLEVGKEAVLPGVWLLALTLAGSGMIRFWLPGLRATSRLALGFGLSMGCVSLILAAADLLGIQYGKATSLGVGFIWITMGSAAGIRAYRRDPVASPDSQQPRRGFAMDAWHAVLLVCGVIALVLSVGKGYHATDEIVLWGVKGYGIAARGMVEGVTSWGTRTVAYPLNIPMQIATFKTLFGDPLPVSKALFPFYYVCLLILIYDYLAGKTPAWIAGLATLLLASAPLTFRHASIGYANLPLAYYLTAGVVLIQPALEAENSRRRRQLLAAGAFLALGAWTRPEGLILGWLIAGVYAAWLIYTKEKHKLDKFLGLVSPLLVYTFFWYAASKLIYPPAMRSSAMATAALEQIGSGNLHLVEAGYILTAILTDLFQPDTWGWVGFSLLGLTLLAFLPPRPHQRNNFFALLAGLVCASLVLGIYQVASYDAGRDISWWVSTGLNRMMLPGIVLIWVGVVSLLNMPGYKESERL